MKEKIDISEILKDCPKGMELDCAMCKNVTLNHISESALFPIKIDTPIGEISLSKYGCLFNENIAKCVIFPKGKTTWEGFQRPFKDGDIIFTHTNALKIGVPGHTWISIFEENRNGGVATYVDYCNEDKDFYTYLDVESLLCMKEEIIQQRLATEEEKQKLFDAIKANGYKWNEEAKTLEKLIQPKFKVGDRIKHKLTGDVYKIMFVLSNGCGGGVYDVAITNEIGKSIEIEEQDNYELDKFDITTLKPFDKVLVRDNNAQKWTADLFSLFDKSLICPYSCVGHYTNQCIPYKGNEHLLGTTNDCNDFYKNW